jgi:WD40 repeat protein
MNGGSGGRDEGKDAPADDRMGLVDGGGDLAHAPTVALGSDEETTTAPPLTPPRPSPPQGTPGGETRAEETRDERRPGAPRPVAPGPARDLPFVDPSHYEIAGEHARGGLGRVLRARDRRLERTVALKELAHGPSSRTAGRFVREALVTARLQHPSIVPIYEAGRWPSGDPFYAMKLVSGESLDEAIEKRPTLDARLALLPHVLAVAEAIAYAHSEGVIHRDLKPANVMLGAFGETQVVDWGLAKDRRLMDDPVAAAEDESLYAHAHADLTRVGSVVGTPAYMPPEQARGEEVDERADVYAIGAMLYHLLAADPPFEGAPDTVVARVAKYAPVPLVERAPEAPRDLVAIVDKAMARDASLRYPTAQELAKDLSRFLTGQLVGARAYGRTTLVWRWLRRHRTPVAVAAVLLTALAIVAVASARRIVREKNVARARSAELILTQARSMLERDPTASLAWLKQYPNDGADWVAARNIAADAYSRGVARHVLDGNVEAITDGAFSPDGRLVATASYDLLQVRAAESGAAVLRLKLGLISRMRFSPDGRWLAVGGDAGEVWLMSIGTGDVHLLGRHTALVESLAFSADVSLLASGGEDGSVSAWNLKDGQRTELEKHAERVRMIHVSAAGDQVTSASVDGQVRVWDRTSGTGHVLFSIAARDADALYDIAADGTRIVAAAGGRVSLWQAGQSEVEEISRHQGAVRTVLLLPDGRVASGGDDATIAVWTPGQAEPARWLGHERPVTALAMATDGSLLASADAGGDIQLRSANGNRVQVLRGHRRSVTGLAFSSTGTLLSWSDDSTARLWTSRAQERLLPLAQLDVFRAAFLDEKTVATTSRDGAVRVIRLKDSSVTELGRQNGAVYDLEVLPDRTGFVTAAWDGTISVWRAAIGAKRVMHQSGQIADLALSPDGTDAATAADDGSVRLWDLATGTNQLVHKHESDAVNVAFSPDGRLLASSGGDHVVYVFDRMSKQGRQLLGHEDVVQTVLFAPGGHELYSSSMDGTARIWNLDSGKSTVLRGHSARVRALAISPDGHLLATGSADRTIRVWNLRDGSSRTLLGHEDEVRSLAFSPDGRLLASAGFDETARLWNLEDGHVSILRGHVGRLHRVSFSPGGRSLVTAGQDGSIGIWDVDGLETVPGSPMGLRRWLSTITNAVIGDGSGLPGYRATN